ncbi:hypothetical protein P3T36_006882 [Kitasatospora sp. MAP12-15]|uniref:hypothetical protein n=1 Tax=unclassified Kitasatospora TaxID=2633591 RepID=UPI00247642A1|nr:hypothetical protein [Kitasatospora sp. MAP12-44]MDH6111935.1 hypothetical protein [Kitasatospora sp. MAP12-44]
MYRPGDVLDVTLHGLPGLAGWALQAQALVLNVSTFTETTMRLLVQDPRRNGPTMFARGRLNTELQDPDSPFIEHPATDGPVPERILLGRVTGYYQHPRGEAGMNALNEQACSALRAHWALQLRGPLDIDDLPTLDLTIAAVRQCRTDLADAESARNTVMQRLRAGGVEPRDMVRPELSASRISQITKPRPADACA